MTDRQPRYDKEEYWRRGELVYEQQVRSQVEADNRGRIVAIDIETGAFEIADSSLQAADQLLLRQPDAQIYCVRIGYKYVHHFGRRGKAGSA